MTDIARFQIVYSGPALENNEMDIRELAPALLAVADLLEETNQAIYGDDSKITVNVHGTFKSGSFGIDFSVIQNIGQNLLVALNSPGVTACANLLQLLGIFQSDGLINFIKKLGKDKIGAIDDIGENKVNIHIIRTETKTETTTKEEIFTADKDILVLFKNPKIRGSLEKIFTEPLNRPGIDEVKTISDESKEKYISVKKEESEIFTMPDMQDEVLGSNDSEAFLQVVSLSFKEDNKWRFARGENVFYATMADVDFLNKINNNEEYFSKDDILKVILNSKDILTNKGIKLEYKVVKVLEHRPAKIQLKLPMVDKL